MTDRPTILVAGATGSIGGAAALALAECGAGVVLLGRRQDRLDARMERIRAELAAGHAMAAGRGMAASPGVDADLATLVIDFADMASVRRAAEDALHRFPRLDGLVLSVGALLEGGPNVLPSGHEAMFATNVMGPFLFTELLLDRLAQSGGLVLHVIAPFEKEIDWNDLESIEHHRTMTAYNRTKMLNRAIAGETARRYAGRISSVAFDPTYVIDKSDPTLADRWPTGLMGLWWKLMTLLFARKPAVAGEPIARLMLEHDDRAGLNGALFKLGERVRKPDRAMNDEAMGRKLWDELVARTGAAA